MAIGGEHAQKAGQAGDAEAQDDGAPPGLRSRAPKGRADLLQSYREVHGILSPDGRRRWLMLMALGALLGAFEAAGILSILPFLAVVSDPSMLDGPSPLGVLYRATGLADPLAFQIWTGAAVFAFLLAGISFRILMVYLQTRFASRQAARLSGRLLAAYLAQPYPWFVEQRTARLSKGVLSEVEQVVNGSVTCTMAFVSYSTVALAILGVLLASNPGPAIAVGAVLSLSYLGILRVVRPRLARLGRAQQAANQSRFDAVSVALSGIKEIKLGRFETVFLGRFRHPAETVAHTRATIAFIAETPRNLLELLVYGGIIAIVLYALAQADTDILAALPMLGLFAFAGVRLFPVLHMLYRSYALLIADGPALALVHRELTELDRPDATPPAGPPLAPQDDITLTGARLTFAGGGRPALIIDSMRLAAGDTVALVGETGAGKSTLIDVLLGLRSLDAGRLAVDGVTVDDANRLRWQAAIGYVPQSVYLLDDTIAANVAFGVEARAIDHGAVARALRVAALTDFVESLPAGLETRVGERGTKISGGQRQRIALARALYRDPAVLILDEPTSALDGETERAVMAALEALEGRRTLIIATHRPETIARCDRVIRLRAGRMITPVD